MSETNNTHSIADYLAQLLKDRKQLAAFPSVFVHVERLLDEGRFFSSYLVWQNQNNDLHYFYHDTTVSLIILFICTIGG